MNATPTKSASTPNPTPRSGPPTSTGQFGRKLWNKVPEITLYFWLIKVLCTTVGETAADQLNGTFLGHDVTLGLNGTNLLMGSLLIVALIVQFGFKKYVPWIYWTAVVLISVVGTLITDKLHDDVGISLQTLTLIFGLALAAIFGAWFAVEKTLSIRTIYTSRREGFYWAAILATFALGTAAGDLGLERLTRALGQVSVIDPDTGTSVMQALHPQAALLLSAGIFALVIGLSAVGHLVFKLNSVLMFWTAYIFTRPLGANIGDVLTLAPEDGGLGLNKLLVNGVFLAAILGSVIYLTVSEKDTRPDPHFIIETQAERALHLTAPDRTHQVVLLEDRVRAGKRRYEIRDVDQRRLVFTGEELASLATWWTNETTRPGVDETPPTNAASKPK